MNYIFKRVSDNLRSITLKKYNYKQYLVFQQFINNQYNYNFNNKNNMLRNSKLLEPSPTSAHYSNFKNDSNSIKNSQYQFQDSYPSNQNSIDPKKYIDNQTPPIIKQSSTKYNSAMINNRLEQIKKKYENKAKRNNGENKGINPLKESNQINIGYRPVEPKGQNISIVNKLKQKNRDENNLYVRQDISKKYNTTEIQNLVKNFQNKIKQIPLQNKNNEFKMTEIHQKLIYSQRNSQLNTAYKSQIENAKPQEFERKQLIQKQNDLKYKVDGIKLERQNYKSVQTENTKYKNNAIQKKSNDQKQEQRIGSIDKINSKIKQMLKSLNENEKKPLERYSEKIDKNEQIAMQKIKLQQENSRKGSINQSNFMSSIKCNSFRENDRTSNKIPNFRDVDNKNLMEMRQVNKKQQLIIKSNQNNTINKNIKQISNTELFIKDNSKIESELKKNQQKKQNRDYFVQQNYNKKSLIQESKDSSNRQNQIKPNTSRDNNKPNAQKNIAIEKPKEQRRLSFYQINPLKNQQKGEIINQRSSSVISKPRGQQYTLSSGKDLDQEIRKIQQKIRKSEDEKIKLNIKFQAMKQFNLKERTLYEAKKKQINQNLVPPFSQIVQDSLKNQSVPTPVETTYQQNINIQKPIQRNINRKIVMEEKNVQIQKTPKKQQNKSILQKEQLKTSLIINQRQNFTSKLQPEKKGQIKKQNYEIIKSNRQHKQEVTIPKIQIKRLVQRLKQQVTLDEQLRNGKVMYSLIPQTPEKLEKLKKQLIKNNISSLTDEIIKSEFQITFEQHNPFQSIQTCTETIQSIVKKYIVAQEYWHKNIQHKFNVKLLSNQNFKLDTMDLERKGYLTVQDFVRFLNFETGTFYRNRDMIVLFRRLTKDGQIRFDKFLETISM